MRLYVSTETVEKSHKLHGKVEFQGLPISIENRAGSARHWYDPNSGEKGSTKMKYPYGYIRGTLGTDGDEVDVFVGPDKDSTKVFVVTQMKKPGFKEVDEQKVMLGFQSAAEAKTAYLDHYNDPKFFGSMKEFPMTDFKEKLTSNKGKLIKHLFLADPSAKIEKAVATYAELANAGMEKAGQMEKSCEHNPNGETCEKCNGTHSTTDIYKALNSRLLSMIARVTKPVVVAAVDSSANTVSGEQTTEVTLFGPQVAQASYVDRPFEQPITKSVHIPTPSPQATILSPDFLSACGGCGYMHKSLSTCPRCAQVSAQNARVATPAWRR